MAEPALALPDDAPHLLVVDDDRRIRDLLSRFLYRGRLSRHHGGQCRGRARQARKPVVRPAGARRDDAGRDRLPACEVAARELRGADPDADREGGGGQPHHRARARRRRLCAEAVRAARALAAHRQHPEAHAFRRRRRRSKSVRFGDFVFHLGRGELKRGEEIVHLTDRERDMLRVLAGSAGRDRAAHGARRQRRRRQRARRRRAGEPAAPQDRARSRQSAVRADRARHRLPAGGRRHDDARRRPCHAALRGRACVGGVGLPSRAG